jgi:hypothetical protein
MHEGEHLEVLLDAIRVEAGAQRRLLAGDAAAADAFREAAELYRASWELAPPRSYGRLIGMLKALVLAGDTPVGAARYALDQIGGEPDSPPASYGTAIALLILGQDDEAAEHAEAMRTGTPAFARTADAVIALGARDQPGYASALAAIVASFEARDEHLTGVPIADTALMLERLAEPRGMAARMSSPLLGG